MREDSRYPMRHGHVLFVGIGGGNDIFSTLFAVSALRHLGWTWERCDIAGVLSPFHDHSVIKTGARCLRITHPHSKRYIPTHEGEPERRVRFIDATVSRLAREVMLTCERVYGLDLAGGSERLTMTFKRLALGYDMIVLVDLGGDCFYGGARDTHVLSPMFDAITLRAFADSGAKGLLFEAGPGTDGELDPEALRQAIFDTGAEPHELPAACIDTFERLYREYIEPVRPGNTVPRTIQAYRSTERTLKVWHHVHAVADERTRYVKHVARRIDTELCRRFYLLDPRKIRNPFMLRCSDPKDWFVKTQVKQGQTTNEAGMQYLRVGEEIWRFAAPSILFAPEWRRLIVRSMVKDLRSKTDADGLWLHPEDAALLKDDWPTGISLENDDGLIAVRRLP